MTDGKTIESYIEEVTAQKATQNITVTASTRVSLRTKLILKKLGELTGQDEKKLAGELLDIATEQAYKKVQGKIQITEQEVEEEARKIEASNKKKGKKKTTM